MRRVLITGASGFVGKALVRHLVQLDCCPIAAVRDSRHAFPPDIATVITGDISRTQSWEPYVDGIDAVVHLAARAHILNERSSNPIEAFRAVNVDPTIALFCACQLAGVSRFVFVSSIGVNGIATQGHAFTEADRPNPSEPYAISKWQAEQALGKCVASGNTALTIIRPALIYGQFAKGNFIRLMRWIHSGMPLPIGDGESRRSYLGLTNFCELLWRCIDRSYAPSDTFVAADPQPLSLVDLSEALGSAMGRKIRFAKLPSSTLRFLGRISGKSAEMQRLIGSLEVDASKARRLLDWPANFAFEQEILSMVRQFLVDKSDGSRSR